MTSARISLHICRTLACASSGLALVFTLQSRSNAQLWASSRAAPTPVAGQALPDSQPQSLSVIAALSKAGDESALAVLIGSAEYAPPEVASAALTGIAQIGGQRALGFLGQRFAEASAA